MNDTKLTPSFTVNEVVKHAYELSQANWKRFIPPFLFSVGVYAVVMILSSIFNANNFPAVNFLIQLVSMFVGSYLSIVLVRFGLAVVDKDNSTLNDWIKLDGKMLLNMVVASLLYGLAVAAGFILLIVPGVILLLMWGMYMFAIVDKQAGILDSFKLSRAWTQGNKWKMFQIYIIYILACVGVLLVPMILFAIILGSDFWSVADASLPNFTLSDGLIGLILILVIAIAALFLMLMQYIGTAYMYRKASATRHMS